MWKIVKNQIWQWRGVWIAAPSLTAIVLGVRSIGWLQPLELRAWDQFFRWRPVAAIDRRIRIVGINEADIRKYGYPISDAKLAQALALLQQQQPRAIGLDLYRDLPVEPGHQALVRVFASTPNLIGIQKVVGNAAGSAINPPPALNQRQQVGANDLVPDADLKIRRNLLSLRDAADKTVFSFSTKLALLYLDRQGITLQPDPQTGGVRLGQAVIRSIAPNIGGYVNADTGGYQTLAGFPSLPQGFEMASLSDVLEKRLPPEFGRDRVVLIGTTAESTSDFFLTPFSDTTFGQVPLRSPGVVIHADAVSQLLGAALDGRPLIQAWSEPIAVLWIAGWAFVGAGLSWGGRYRRSGLGRIPVGAIALVGLTTGLIAAGYGAFLLGWWIPVVPPLLTLFGTTIAITSYTASSAAGLRRTFGRYLSDDIVANLLETPGALKLGGEKRKVTILVSDLRGFSAISERVPPETAVSILNLYLDRMTEVISTYQGTINEVMGDGMFVLFGTPVHREDDSQRAIACAIAMQLAMDAINLQLDHQNLPLLEMGIGLNTGEVLAGNIGSQRRAKYTVIGSPVNLAARIESYTVGGQVLASQETLKDAGDILRLDGQSRVQPKGFQDAIVLSEIGGIGGRFNLSLPNIQEELLPLQPEIPLHCTIVEGKHLANTGFSVWIVKLATHSAELRSSQALERLTNLQLTLMTGNEKARGLGDLYAKVVEGVELGGDRTLVRVRFTGIPPEVAALFAYLRHS